MYSPFSPGKPPAPPPKPGVPNPGVIIGHGTVPTVPMIPSRHLAAQTLTKIATNKNFCKKKYFFFWNEKGWFFIYYFFFKKNKNCQKTHFPHFGKV